MKKVWRLLVVVCGAWTLAVSVPAASLAQALYTANGPGTYISVGVTAAGYESDYGRRLLAGGTIFVDANPYRRFGVEAEARDLRFHADEGIRQKTYMVGPKISLKPRAFRPYAKFLVGRGDFDFPFGYARGSYVAIAPGGGVDLRRRNSRVLVRLIDFEYQLWPGFTYGALHPYGFSSGISIQVFGQ